MDTRSLRLDLLAVLSSAGVAFAFGCGESELDEDCTPDCTDMECGGDGCGGSCGTCSSGEVCQAGACVACTPDCTGRECGSDGCGGSCGTCSSGEVCQAGACVGCTPDCTGRECGDDGCGGSCGTCPSGEVCQAGTCVGCTPDCTGRECGDDGCGGSCGTCPSGEVCEAGACIACVPDCADKECGDDGCGGSCGVCLFGAVCVDGACVTECTPDCTGRECGDDGCGGSCGECGAGETCDELGQCITTPVVFAGGTIDDLQQIRPSLDFSDLTVQGTLVIPADRGSVTISGDNLVFQGGIDTRYPTCSQTVRSGPNLTLRARSELRIEAGIDLAGKRGEEETSTTQCHNCTGGRGGSLRLEAASIDVGGALDLSGGGGSRYVLEPDYRYGCDGGAGGDLVMQASSRVEADPWDVDTAGGNGGLGLGTNAPSGADGTEGSISLSAPSVSLTEQDDLNVFTYNAQRIPYVPLDLEGTVNFADDRDYKGRDHTFTYFIGDFQDLIEDVYRIDVATARTIDVTLRFASYDLDLYLMNEAETAVLTQSNGTERPESFTWSAAAGTYYLGVSFADDNIILPSPVPYTLELR